jgi:hypothetical protein
MAVNMQLPVGAGERYVFGLEDIDAGGKMKPHSAKFVAFPVDQIT